MQKECEGLSPGGGGRRKGGRTSVSAGTRSSSFQSVRFERQKIDKLEEPIGPTAFSSGPQQAKRNTINQRKGLLIPSICQDQGLAETKRLSFV